MSTPTVAVNLFNAVFDYVETKGYSEQELLEKAQLHSKQQVLTGSRVPLLFYEHLFIAAEQLTGDSDIGYNIGRKPFPATWGVIYFLILSADSIDQILTMIKRYLPIAYDFIDFEMSQVSETTFRMNLRYRHNHRPHQQVINHFMANWYTVAAKLSFDTEKVPRVIGFKNSAPKNCGIVEKTFARAPVLFDQPEDFVEIPLESLSCKTISHNKDVFNLMSKHAEELLVGIRSKDKITEEITKEIVSILPQGSPKIEAVANRLNCSGRTLQRRLYERNLTYQQLVDNIRKEMAVSMLQTDGESIENIALKTGFNDGSAFHRAFKRWTGLSPGQFRK